MNCSVFFILFILLLLGRVIKQEIKNNKPPIVIFYGSTLLEHWNEIAQIELKAKEIKGR